MEIMVGSPDDSNRQAGVRTHLDANPATHASGHYDGTIKFGKVEANGFFAQRAGHGAGTTNSAIHPGVAGIPVDDSDAHINIVPISNHEGIRRTGIHTFATQDTSLFRWQYIGGIGFVPSRALVELDTGGRTDLGAQTAADAGLHKHGIIGLRTWRAQFPVSYLRVSTKPSAFVIGLQYAPQCKGQARKEQQADGRCRTLQ
jgi:hypothetical protein